MERMWEEENFLAYKMNGEILPPAHGYPLRIFLPGKFGMKQPKWVTRIELIREKYLGYWEKKGLVRRLRTCGARTLHRFEGRREIFGRKPRTHRLRAGTARGNPRRRGQL